MTGTQARTTSTHAKWAAVAACASLLALAAVLTAAGCCVERTEAGGGSAELSMSPLTIIELAGVGIEVDVRIDGVTDFGGYELDIAYDPNVLQFERWEDAGLLTATGRAQLCQPSLFPSPGVVGVACSTLTRKGPAGPAENGIIGTLTFRTSCSGSSMITFWDASISDTAGAAISHVRTAGSFVLLTAAVDRQPCSNETPTPERFRQASPTPVFSATATPTPTATPPLTPLNGCGDANDDGTVDAVDAAFVLFKVADRIQSIPNPEGGDVDASGHVDSVDAVLILQLIAGLIGQGALSCTA